ncbi:cell division protein [Streptomyces sp. 604F]|uniref:SsgA family sporulation/cell division regulator n=1 Tax=Streptomyces TaxID=1883 RepID=UPI0013970594|nr:SsgA family sporulation/cell division regulator [Streptomyces sp. 604F]MBP3077813.1 cell division protein [Streptomyces sp. 604F]QHV87047.1 SsgA family sporulation/cell division regulator [Streptomyces sp. 604F]
MTAAVEQRARGYIVTDGNDHFAVPVLLRYDPDAARGAERPVVLHFPGAGFASPDREVPRALLEAGLRTTCTEGGVRVWPCGRVQTVVEFHAPGEEPLVIQFDSVVLIRFLRRTHAEGPAGEPAVAAAAHEPGPAAHEPGPAAATSATTGTTPTGAPG